MAFFSGLLSLEFRCSTEATSERQGQERQYSIFPTRTHSHALPFTEVSNTRLLQRRFRV